MHLEIRDDPEDHHCDYYAKSILKRFVERLERRMNTRILLRIIDAAIAHSSTEIEYHVRLLHELDREGNSDLYDRPLLQRIKDESRAIMKAERDFGPGCEDVQKRFEDEIVSNLNANNSI